MIGRIALTQGQFALVDGDDYDWLMQWKWFYSTGYAMRNSSKAGGAKRQAILMHRVIVAPAAGFFVDHINCDRLDNRRANLRICTPEQNTHNRSPHAARRSSAFKGVCWNKSMGKWEAQITHGLTDGKRRKTLLGYFDREIDAAQAYDTAALRLFGEFAYLNFPQVRPL